MLLDLNAFSVGLVACLLYVRWAFSSMVCNCRQGRVEEATKGMVCFLKEVFDSKLLAKNLLLVVTHVSQSKPALKQRQASGKSLDLILRDISICCWLNAQFAGNLTCNALSMIGIEPLCVH